MKYIPLALVMTNEYYLFHDKGKTWLEFSLPTALYGHPTSWNDMTSVIAGKWACFILFQIKLIQIKNNKFRVRLYLNIKSLLKPPLPSLLTDTPPGFAFIYLITSHFYLFDVHDDYCLRSRGVYFRFDKLCQREWDRMLMQYLNIKKGGGMTGMNENQNLLH